MNQHDYIASILQQVLSGIPGGPLLSPFLGGLTGLLSDPTSISNQFIWPGTNQSMQQAAFQYINNMRSRGFGTAASAFSDEQTIRALTEYHRMLNPGLSNDQLRGLAENSASNPFSGGSLLYQFTDPYKLNAALPAASTLSSTLHSVGSNFSIAGATYAKQIANTIYGYTDSEGNRRDGILSDVIKNPGMYGHLSAADVMHVGRELALTEQGNFKGYDGNFDSSRFKTRLKEVSKSLEPWKDIFGKDIPEVLNQLEALTGTSLGSSSGDLNMLGHRMSAIMGTTGARIQHIAAYKDALAKNLIDPTMSNRSILGAAALAGDLTLGMSNLSLNSMTSQELQGSIARYYTGTAQSKYAERFALAYARWADSNGGDKASIDSFRQALRSRMDAGDTHQQALLRVSGVSNIQQLDMYKNTDAYLKAIQDGAGFNMTREVFMRDALSDVRSGIASGRFAAMTGDVVSAIQGLNNEDLTRFLGSSMSNKIKTIRSWDTTLNAEQATAIANDIQLQAMRSTMSDSVEDATARFASSHNETVQAKRAAELASFRKKVSDLQGPGGLAGILAEIEKTGGKADVKDLFKAFTGGTDMLSPLIESFSNLSSEDLQKILTEDKDNIIAGMNFAVNNYAELGKGGRYESIGAGFQSSDRDTMIKAYKQAAALNAVGTKNINKLDDKAFNRVLADIQTAQKEGKDVITVAKDSYIDEQLSKSIGSAEGMSTHWGSSKAIIEDLIKGSYTSKEAMRKAYESRITGSDDQKKDMLRDFDRLWSSSKVGDLDGTDNLQKISKFLEDLPEKIERLITALSSLPDKRGGK